MMMPLKDIFKNKLLLQENFHTSEISMDDWPFWQFEENIKIANEIIEDKEKNRKKQEEGQKQQMPNMNTSQYTNSMSGLMNKFKR
jgi:hypothetical protein